jgi:hypothetical protein
MKQNSVNTNKIAPWGFMICLEGLGCDFSGQKELLREYHRGVRSLVCGLACVLVLLFASAVVFAAPLSAELAVERAPGTADCPDESALETLIARVLNDEPADASGGARPPGTVKILVQFTRTSVGYQATLRLHGAKEGERTLTDTGPTCAALGRAVSITMALLLDAHEPDELKPAPPAVEAVAPPPSAPPPARNAAAFLAVAGGPVIGLVGSLRVAGALELDLDVHAGRRARLRIGGEYVAPQSTSVAIGNVEVALFAGRLALCGVLNDPAAALRVAVCGEGAAGQLVGTGSGFSSSRASSLTWLAAGAGVDLTVPIGTRWELAARGAVLAPLRKYTFSLGTASGGREVIYASARVSGTLQLCVGVKVW